MKQHFLFPAGIQVHRASSGVLPEHCLISASTAKKMKAICNFVMCYIAQMYIYVIKACVHYLIVDVERFYFNDVVR